MPKKQYKQTVRLKGKPAGFIISLQVDDDEVIMDSFYRRRFNEGGLIDVQPEPEKMEVSEKAEKKTKKKKDKEE